MPTRSEIWKAEFLDLPNVLWESILRNYRYSHHHMRTLALFAVVGEPVFFLFWRISDPQSYESLTLRLLGALICVPLLFAHERVKEGRESETAAIFVVAVTYCLPFLFCFLLLKNASLVVAPATTPIQWPLQYTVSLILLVLLFPSGILASLLFVLATVCAWFAFVVSGGESTPEVSHVVWHLMPIYLFILAAGTVFNANREVIDQAKLRAMSEITCNIAHELRTPFLGIKALAEGVGMHLPELIRAYDLAKANRFEVAPIRRRQMDRLRTSLREIETETNHSNSIIDRLLINTSERPVEDHEFQYFSAQACVIEALHRYPFVGRYERDLVSLDLDRNFVIHAPNVLMVHVLFNLLKNGIYYVHKAGKGELTVTTVQSLTGAHAIIIEDTGTGIPPQNLKRIFERFYTTSESGHGSGIGLSFCKMVMDGLGGSITCESEFGVYTRFTLLFPRTDNE